MQIRNIVLVGIGGTVMSAAPALAAPVVRSAAGPNPAAIQAAVDQFRTDISGSGGLRAPNTGPFAEGRREINWDAVPAGFSSPNNMPADFFNNNSRRGAVFSADAPGATFQVSQTNNANPADPLLRFGDIDPSYNTIFQAFSQQKLFVVRGTTHYDTTFRVPVFPGEAATVMGFGAVFTDVDDSTHSRIEYYDAGGTLLGSFNVPAADNGLSFLGVSFNAGERIARVRIFTGNAALGPGVLDGPGTDVVALDDFFYSEPIPAPGSLALVAVGVTAAARRRRRP